MSKPVKCETCDGTTEVYLGHERHTREAPGEPVYGRCPVCVDGMVDSETLDDGVFPSEEDAAEQIIDRYQDRGCA